MKDLSHRNFGEINCLNCNILFKKISPTHKYCGSVKNKIGCSWKCIPEKMKINHRKSYEKDKLKPNFTLMNRILHLKQDYHITLEDYDRMLKEQNGLCAICKGIETSTYKNYFAIDHSHECCKGRKSCGKCVRGLLCENCNRAIGLFKEDITRIKEAINYLETRNIKWLITKL